jgi:hypothetical protein
MKKGEGRCCQLASVVSRRHCANGSFTLEDGVRQTAMPYDSHHVPCSLRLGLARGRREEVRGGGRGKGWHWQLEVEEPREVMTMRGGGWRRQQY